MLQPIETLKNYSGMPSFKGKTIEKIKINEKGGCIMIYFDDETWVGISEADLEKNGAKICMFHKDDKSHPEHAHFWRTVLDYPTRVDIHTLHFCWF